MVTIFLILAPMIGFGRVKTSELGGGQQIATLEQRWMILMAYMNGERLPGYDAETQDAAYSRQLCQHGGDGSHWYDEGRHADSLSHVFAVFIPRFVWPDKPDLTETGRVLYALATGQVGTSISPGLFAEAYANFGWWGLPSLMLPLGMVLALLNRVAVRLVLQSRWLYLPVVLMGVQVGTRVDGHFVIDVVGVPFTIAIVYGCLRAVEILTARRHDPKRVRIIQSRCYLTAIQAWRALQLTFEWSSAT